MAQVQYATAADLQALAITQAAAARFGPTAIDACLQAASSLIDSYISAQFQLPLTAWDMGLTLQCCNIARFMLYRQVGFNPSSGGDETTVNAYNDAIAWLENVRDEKIHPQWTASPVNEAAASDPVDYVVTDPPVGFTVRGNSQGNVVSTGWPSGDA